MSDDRLPHFLRAVLHYGGIYRSCQPYNQYHKKPASCEAKRMEVGGPQVNDAGHSGASDRDDDIYMGWHHQSAAVHHGSGDHDRVLDQQRAENKAFAVHWLSVRTFV